MKHIPDLLGDDAKVAADYDRQRQYLQYAFHSGESAGALRRSLAETPPPESHWDAGCFEADLFVDDLIEAYFKIGKERFKMDFLPPQNFEYLKKILVHPPGSLKSVKFRQEIQRELRDEAIRKELEAVYQNLAELRGALDSAGIMGTEYSTRRRIDILVAVKESIDLLAVSFEKATSGIGRIRHYAEEFRGTNAFAMLRDFVEYEERLSRVHLDVQVALDGTIRDFKIVEIKESKDNRFFQSPLRRFFGWFRLFMRGYGVSRDELVARTVELVFDALLDDLVHLLPLMAHVEFHLAVRCYEDRLKAANMPTCFPTFVSGEHGRAIRDLTNPFLVAEDTRVVPCDVKTRRRTAMTIITGPNSGGKTRLLQAVGLLQLLGQTGCPVPASRAELYFNTGMFISLVEETRADQKEGKLGTELLRIRHLFENSDADTLVILDELCSGTNPSEGEEIFFLVISLLGELGPEAFISTHFLRFAAKLMREQTLEELEFIKTKLDSAGIPTFEFVRGVADTSLAGRTAERLGVTKEQLTDLIQKKKQKSNDN